MDTQEQKLKLLLTGQEFEESEWRQELLEKRKAQVCSYVQIENGIAVLSDFQRNIGYIYAGSFGANIGLTDTPLTINSAFEDEIFSCILPEDLLERHILELRYLQFQKDIPISERRNFNTICSIHFKLSDNRCIPVLHRTCYLESLSNGSVWLALCLYTPYIDSQSGMFGQIVNNMTGEVVPPKDYEHYDHLLLSSREKEVLKLLAKGCSSKQIADILYISVNTVYRHRQNILSALQVNNTAAAVQIGFRLNII